MDQRRFLSWVLLSFAILMFSQMLFPPPPPPEEPDAARQIAEKDQDAQGPKPLAPAEQDKPSATGAAGEAVPAGVVAGEMAKAIEVPLEFYTLGSVDPESGYRMLITLTNQGAAVERIELSSPRYRDLDFRSGYLGHIAPTRFLAADQPGADSVESGVVVDIVGRGTPADKAGLKQGDRIVGIGGDQPIANRQQLSKALESYLPEQSVVLEVQRKGGALESVSVTLTRRPLELVRPEIENLEIRGANIPPGFESPPSFLATITSIDGVALDENTRNRVDALLRDTNWEVSQHDARSVTMRRLLPELQLEVIKRYTLKPVPPDQLKNATFPGYDFDLDVEVKNLAPDTRNVAYRLAGPNGLPIEGWWYANRISRTWSAAGLRDVVVRFEGEDAEQVRCSTLADEDPDPMGQGVPLAFASVDAQYFASALIPKKKALEDLWFDETQAIRIGPKPEKQDRKTYTNVSFEVERRPVQIESGQALQDSYRVFAGPKRPELLAHYYVADAKQYNLTDLIYYGWFGAIAKGMLAVLHTFYGWIGNYGIAIIMLTVVVRGCMFPLSYKQTQNMARMQALKPELDRITEKYKNDTQKKQQAMQELYAKHKVNPLSGCLPLFVQLPIFMGLYRGLMIDIELRQSPLFSDSIRWCSNLAAPDMFYNWSAFMPKMINDGVGFFGLGPYLNVLPLVTVFMFLISQKMFMPEATNDQAALQQKMMKYMTLFMGLIFYKVAAGLCLYFIVSSLWGIVERKLLPKATTGGEVTGKSALGTGAAAKSKPGHASSSDKPRSTAPARNGSPKDKKRQKAKRKK
ncbi:MAG: YidC/Oxa1 family insertase periplasmic-domain containing protein [Pirellulales bacterium]|nr:YidC/Oxa1 family insertase periplasmic-domain containing protein [Pirellulales bacterium]